MSEERLSRREIMQIGKAAREGRIEKVLELKEKGYTNVAIAEEVGLSESSVRAILKKSE